MESIQEIATAWRLDEPKYQELGNIITSFIKSKITECEILPEVSHRTKDLLSIVKKIKKKLREKPYSYYSINDKLGVRIICTFQEDLDKVDLFLKKYFRIKNVEYKQQALNFDKLDYISNHYDATINSAIKPFDKYSLSEDLVFEVQVRTLNQHAWSNTAHFLSYKQEANISSSLKRKVYRLLSLYEIADDEFSAVNNELLAHPDNVVYILLRKLESKIYKYAQVDFDRETSLFFLRTILTYVSPHQIRKILSDIDEFIVRYDKKIEGIFNSNRVRFYEIPILTQPEVFLIWLMLEKYYYEIVGNWENDFDKSELEQISILWGQTLD